ncbi:DUF2784 domain-containing protein [Kineobactrum salinum]|uniref:DUF2784 domain-containing protein n=1 Tax=Kineobactrum salinum TaxID=2708301 RepID=A0A6C0U1L2_9GAMM|nr:DUF2784 domain-containing protein [Kineobactrum salinum]QIB65931.1 DUF2784 domain-containing protein [Kineobactrum salinum]
MGAASFAADHSAVQLAYLLAADAVLLLHALFVAFVIVGLLLILAGGVLGWRWVRKPVFRWLHLLAIAVVVAQAWAGLVCPLTSWEMALRERAGEAVYAGGFIAHWLEQLLYYRAPEWVFVMAYSLFGLLVLASWVLVRPRPWRKR